MSTPAGRRSSSLPWVLLALVIVAVAAGDGLRLAHAQQSAAPAFDAWLETTVNALSFATVGALVARHRPGNGVGWLFLGIGGAAAAQLLTGEYAMYGVYVREGELPGVPAAAWLSTVTVTALLVALPVTMLLFPDGQLVSRRWRPVLWLNIVSGALLLTGLGFARGVLDNTAGIDNPFGALPSGPAQQVANAAGLGLLCSVIAAMASLAVRWHRCGPDGRQQLKWVVFAAVGGPSSILLFTALLARFETGWLGSFLWAVGIGVIPAAAGVSILRYRLYDIDRLISRTVSYAILTGLLVGLYVALVTLATRLAPTGDTLTVAGSTLAVAAVFQPLRRSLQSGVDRRFNRSRYDADRTVDVFTRRLRQEVDLDQVRSDLLHVVQDTMQPATAGLWLRDAGR